MFPGVGVVYVAVKHIIARLRAGDRGKSSAGAAHWWESLSEVKSPDKRPIHRQSESKILKNDGEYKPGAKRGDGGM